jgi:hypothetical protein
MVRVGMPRAATVAQKGNPAKTAAAPKTTELAKGVRETSKPQKSAHHQNQRGRSTGSPVGQHAVLANTVARASRPISGERVRVFEPLTARGREPYAQDWNYWLAAVAPLPSWTLHSSPASAGLLFRATMWPR